jgi:hypothetical protein
MWWANLPAPFARRPVLLLSCDRADNVKIMELNSQLVLTSLPTQTSLPCQCSKQVRAATKQVYDKKTIFQRIEKPNG